MATWVEQFVGEDVRVLGVLSERTRRGRSSLTYMVAQTNHPDIGPFADFDSALEVARTCAQAVGS